MPAKKRTPRRSVPPMPLVQRPTVVGVTTGLTPGDRGRSQRPLGRSAIAVGGAVVAVTLAVYLATAARDIVFGDSPELAAVAATLGVAHPPGYPLWTLVAHLVSLLPLGPIPFRIGLVSVISGAACVGVVYGIALRLSRSVPASALAALALAFQPLFWSWSIVAEVFALNALLGSVVLYSALRWYETPARWRLLAGSALAGGLGMANQQTIVLVAPAVLYLLWRRRRALATDPSIIAKAAAAFSLGLSPYLYLPIAAATDPAWSFGDISSIGDVFGVILRSAYGSGQLIANAKLQGGATVDRIAVLGASFGALTAMFALLGLIQAWRRERNVFWGFAIALLFAGPFFVAYANIDPGIAIARAILERFFVLPLTIAAPLVALGVQLIADAAAYAGLRTAKRWTELGLAAVGLAVVAITGGAAWSAMDRHDDHAARTFGMDLLVGAPQGALLVVSGDAALFPVQYLRTVEGARPDLTVVQKTYLTQDWYVRQLQRRGARVALPYPAFDRPPATFRAFLAANVDRPLYIAGNIFDETTQGTLVGEPRGLLQLVVPVTATLDPDRSARETDRVFALYHPPDPAAVKGHAFELAVLNDYGLALVRVGQEYEAAKRPTDAKPWYERALRVVPDLPEAKSALARLK